MQLSTKKEDSLGELSESSDAALVQRIQNGSSSHESREAAGILYDRYNERIFRYLWMRLSDRLQAEDLTGEVFARMLASLPNYEERALPFQAWLYRIAHNLLIDQYRKNATRTSLPLEDLREIPMEDHDLTETVENKMMVEKVQRAISNLDSLKKDVIILRFLVGLSIKEVAAILDKTEASIKALQHRGLQDLRLTLES